MDTKQQIQDFIKNAKSPAAIAYEYGVPTGGLGAKTGGYGNPGEIQVLLVDRETFKTRRSKHVVLDNRGSWAIRRDFGTIKGHCAKARKEAEDVATGWAEKLGVEWA